MKRDLTVLGEEESYLNSFMGILPRLVAGNNEYSSDFVDSKDSVDLYSPKLNFTPVLRWTVFSVGKVNKSLSYFDGDYIELIIDCEIGGIRYNLVWHSSTFVDIYDKNFQDEMIEKIEKLYDKLLIQQKTIETSLVTMYRREYFPEWYNRMKRERNHLVQTEVDEKAAVEQVSKSLDILPVNRVCILSDTHLTSTGRGDYEDKSRIITTRIQETYQFVEEAWEEESCNKKDSQCLFVISGDITDNSLEIDYLLFHWILLKTDVDIRRFLPILGNHDAYHVFGTLGVRDKGEKIDRFYRNFHGWKNAYSEFNKKGDRNQVTLYEISPTKVIITLNTNNVGKVHPNILKPECGLADGVIYKETLVSLRKILKNQVEDMDKHAIIVFHHSIESVDGGKEFEKLLIEFSDSIECVVYGHTHKFDKHYLGGRIEAINLNGFLTIQALGGITKERLHSILVV